MKIIKWVIISLIIALTLNICVKSIKDDFWSNYQEISIKPLALGINEKKVLNEKSVETNVGLWNYYYNDSNTITVYMNDVLENKNYDLPKKVNNKNIIYKNFSYVDEYKKIDDDVFYIDKDGQVSNFMNELSKNYLKVNYEDSRSNLVNYISIIIIIGLITFYLFLTVFDLNRKRKEIIIKKIFGIEEKTNFGYIRNGLLLLFIFIMYVYISTHVFKINLKYYIIAILFVILFQIIDILMERKMNNTLDIVKYVKGEKINSIFSKLEYYILLFFKFISFISIILISFLIFLTLSFAFKYNQYSKVKDYYNFDGYLEISEMSQSEYLRNSEENINLQYTYNGQKDFVNYVEDPYDGIYAYDYGDYQDYDPLNDSGNYIDNLVVCNNNYLRINDESDLIKSEDRDYLLIPSELKDNTDAVVEQINTLDVGKDEDIYYYDSINQLYNIDGNTLTYKRPILYVNNTYGNEFMYVYAFQTMLFKGGKDTIINYYNDYNIDYQDSEISSYSRYNQYKTIVYTLVKQIIYLTIFIALIIFILIFVIKEKIKIYFLENKVEFTLRKIHGQKRIYSRIYSRYLFLDFLFLIPVIVYTVIICIYTSTIQMLYINLIVYIILFVLLDILIIHTNIRRIEKKNILDTVKGEN